MANRYLLNENLEYASALQHLSEQLRIISTSARSLEAHLRTEKDAIVHHLIDERNGALLEQDQARSEVRVVEQARRHKKEMFERMASGLKVGHKVTEDARRSTAVNASRAKGALQEQLKACRNERDRLKADHGTV